MIAILWITSSTYHKIFMEMSRFHIFHLKWHYNASSDGQFFCYFSEETSKTAWEKSFLTAMTKKICSYSAFYEWGKSNPGIYFIFWGFLWMGQVHEWVKSLAWQIFHFWRAFSEWAKSNPDIFFIFGGFLWMYEWVKYMNGFNL